MTTKFNQSTAEFIRDEDTGQVMVRVGAQSLLKPELRATHDILVGGDGARNFEEITRKVCIAGAACAEYLGNKYGEAMSPGQCEVDSKKAFRVECQRLSELQKGVGEKIKLARQRCWLLSNEHVEHINKIYSLFHKGGYVLPPEMTYLDKIINSVYDA